MDTSPPPAAAAVTPKPAAPAATPRRLRRILSLDDLERAARRHLPPPIFAYVSGGCETNLARHDNRAVFDEYRFVTRILTSTSKRSLRTRLLGQDWAAPFGIAPMGMSALSAYQGDLVQARAAAQAGIPMIMSGSSLIPLEQIVQAYPQAWFQAYVPGEPARILALLDRVERAGYGTLVVTVDTPVSGNRENNTRAGFSSPLRPSLRLAWDGVTHPRWLFGTALKTLWRHGMPHFENSQATRGAPILSRNVMRDFGARDHLDWSHFDLIRNRWRGRLVLKGVLHPRDAVLAREHGADAIIVSNHGGRQLDGAASPMRVLPAIVQALGPDYPVMLDSGIRRGTDVLKALALGAHFVFVGRPFNYAGAIAGQAGVAHAIDILRQEVHRNMALLGMNAPRDLDAGELLKVAPAGSPASGLE
ncbi:alpha-hydroxy acid oxidase [Achromobacter aloeverae]|uniref:Alpha-hydroxy-acid oxidizing enzyme n=1 Tax=Achromobacter aloeverae TaxID=1750518 RepID=A0A4Q1HLC9_9BURK|nr:alpha-hydroxy acid oxidase [Achromobacter aloeverae]RXN90308.1 alpha-hydroxy-acid oxidizing enzyme [Achromobacter aloeverae]